jgi:hypothetical protein
MAHPVSFLGVWKLLSTELGEIDNLSFAFGANFHDRHMSVL